MTPEEIKELRELCATAQDRSRPDKERGDAATDLEMILFRAGFDGGDGEISALLDAAEQLAAIRERLERLRPLGESATVALAVKLCDATFIAAARNEIAAMLKEIRP